MAAEQAPRPHTCDPRSELKNDSRNVRWDVGIRRAEEPSKWLTARFVDRASD